MDAATSLAEIVPPGDGRGHGALPATTALLAAAVLIVSLLPGCMQAPGAATAGGPAQPRESATPPADQHVSTHPVVANVIELVDAGRFKAAEAAIASALEPGRAGQADLSSAVREALLFQRERMRRILIDFPYTQAEVVAAVREDIPDLREGELAAWEQAGVLECKVIDGRKLYFDRAVSNLYRLSADARARRATPPAFGSGPMETLNAHQRQVRAKALATGKTSVLPQRVRVTQSLTVEPGAVPAGETVRAWIPFPRAIEGQQEAIELMASRPDDAVVAPPQSALQRTVYLEQPAQAGEPTEFSITYELTIYARDFAIDPEKVVPLSAAVAAADDGSTPTSSFPRRREPMDVEPAKAKSMGSRLRGNDGRTFDPAAYLGERPPHIVFTEDLRAFSRKVVGDETDPYRIAQKLFAAVDDIPWAGAREYSTISNISDYALHAGHADCGQQTLLLMTLLRLNGIPARWQSGMVFAGGVDADGDGDQDRYWNLHDWGWLYLAPYGWVPMDVTTGRFQGTPLEWFYLGGLDGYRIAFNDGYATPFTPPRQHFRSETVDSQRGEAEWRGGNLYFDQWDYDFKARVLPSQPVPTDPSQDQPSPEAT